MQSPEPTSPGSLKRYNPITCDGTKHAPPVYVREGQGKRYFPDRAESPTGIIGPGCVPSPEPAESPREALRHSGKLIPPGARGRGESLVHQSCVPAPGSEEALRGKKNPATNNVTLRASVDHLSGEACSVRNVQAQPTAEAPPPVIQRGMVTKNMQDRMRAAAAKQDIQRSQLYEPGQGYQIGRGGDGTW